jgi:hypothetical protein
VIIRKNPTPDEPTFFVGQWNPKSPTTEVGTITILAWNVESGGSDPDVIAQQLKELMGYNNATGQSVVL